MSPWLRTCRQSWLSCIHWHIDSDASSVANTCVSEAIARFNHLRSTQLAFLFLSFLTCSNKNTIKPKVYSLYITSAVMKQSLRAKQSRNSILYCDPIVMSRASSFLKTLYCEDFVIKWSLRSGSIYRVLRCA